MPSLVEISHFIRRETVFRHLLKNQLFIFFISRWSPLWEGRGPSFEETWIPFTQRYLVQSLVENDPVVREKDIFNSCQIIFIISQFSFLWEGCAPSFEQTRILFTQGYFVPRLFKYFVPSLVEIGPVDLEKLIKMWKVTRRKDRRTDRQQEIRKVRLSFQLRWAKNWLKHNDGVQIHTLTYSG